MCCGIDGVDGIVDQQWLLGGKRGPPLSGAPSLNLNFMSPGALDPRIAFTRTSTATYFDSTRTMRLAAANQPRWDYDPQTSRLRGLLIEEQRSNFLYYSADFTTGNWGPVAVTLATGQPSAPDGTATLTRVVETTASSAHYVGQALAGLVASAVYTFSLYARAQQNRYLQLAFDDGNVNGAHATFDLQTGTVSGPLTIHGTGTIVAATIQDAGGGTYRCTIANTIGATTSGRVLILLSNAAAPGFAPSYVGNAANGLLIWGAQLEGTAWPSSYIPSAGAGGTRASDNCIISATNMGWFRSPGGSWFAEFISIDTSTGKNIRIIGEPVAAVATPLYRNPTLNLGQNDISNAMNTANTIAPNVVTKAASTWAAGASKLCLNGSTVASAATLTTGYASMATNGVAFMITNAIDSSENMSGCVRRAGYWPRVLADAEMQSLTT
jgi:hypothetical protein